MLMFIIWFVAPIAAMICYGMTLSILKKIIRREEFPSADIGGSIFIASILFGVVIFAINTAILAGAQ